MGSRGLSTSVARLERCAAHNSSSKTRAAAFGNTSPKPPRPSRPALPAPLDPRSLPLAQGKARGREGALRHGTQQEGLSVYTPVCTHAYSLLPKSSPASSCLWQP